LIAPLNRLLMLDALHVECTHLYKYADEFWLHVIKAVSCDLELLNYQWLWCRALARELSTQTSAAAYGLL
jgi:hypothetical protein